MSSTMSATTKSADSAASKHIEFDAVSKRFPTGVLAVDNVSLTIEPGEFVAVVGPSGCGKSTLLRMAAGLSDPSGGAVRTGADRMGFIFQEATLMPWRSVRRNVEICCELQRLPKAVVKERAMQAITTVGLVGFENQLPGQLSGGMKMRVSLARALALAPDIFLFDEPFGALDEITRLQMQEELQRIFAGPGFTGMFVTHSVSEAIFLATKVAVMSARPGRITEVIDVAFAHPRPPELRFTPEFSAIAARVSAALKASH